MSKFKITFLSVLLFITSYSLHAQYITKIIPQYVLINRDTGVGELNEEVDVYRLVGDRIVHVGRVKILRFEQGKAAAKIINVNPGMQIVVGDFVRPGSSVVTPGNQSNRSFSSNRRIHDQLGIHLARFVPASNLESGFQNSYNIGASFKLIGMKNHSLYMDVSYPLMKFQLGLPNDIKSSLLIIQLSDRIRVWDRVYYNIGYGFYRSTLSGNIAGIAFNETRSYGGFFIGLSLDLIVSPIMTIAPTIRMHTYNIEGNWAEFVVGGVNVYFSVF
ncbi:hypothetical protein JW824_06730 [bacterium]|nr:hypothetical protein [bacterium]